MRITMTGEKGAYILFSRTLTVSDSVAKEED